MVRYEVNFEVLWEMYIFALFLTHLLVDGLDGLCQQHITRYNLFVAVALAHLNGG